MSEVSLACIMTGVNHLAPIRGPMTYFMQIVYFQILRTGANNYFFSHSSPVTSIIYSCSFYGHAGVI